jgi:transposase
MRKIREVLRLSLGDGLSRRRVGAATGLPYTTVADYLVRARAAGLAWPLPDGLDDAALEARLFSSAGPPAARTRPLPDWATVHRELRRTGVTLQLLWIEYRERHPDGYGYTQFVEHYRRWARHLDVVMRHEHRAGEKLFVDYPGATLPIVDPDTGEIHPAQLFVAALGASSYTYAEATASQALPDWIAAHVRCFEFLGAVPAVVVPDNLRSGVTEADRYEPEINRTYAELAAHYGTAIIPARPRKPRDKAKVEAAVLVATRWIIAALRNRTFFSLGEANAAIAERLAWLNGRPFKRLPGSRASLFAELDAPALRPLPARRFEYAVWTRAKVSIDYHVEIDRHFYSVPYRLVGEQAEVRTSATTVELYVKGRRVASHLRSHSRGRHTTEPAHMPEAHRRHLEWSPGRIVRWAEQTGPATGGLVGAILASRPHPEQGYRSCLGILRLGRRYGPERLEAACARALVIGARSYRSVDSILKRGLDRSPLPEPPAAAGIGHHENVRGGSYYE